ncbi:histamine H2 receptor-like [Oculina patagonica]
MKDTQDTRSLPAVIVHTVILAATTLLSLTGNSFVCLAFYRKRRLRTITNFYVLSLAVADIMVAAFVFPFRTIASGARSWPFSNKLCQSCGFLVIPWATVSLWTLALTSINRYFCVVKPQRYSVYFTKKKTILSILSIWIFQLLVSATFYSAAPSVYRWHPNRLFCKDNYRDQNTEMVTQIIFTCFIFLSMLLVLFGYGRVYHVVRQHNRVIVPSLQNAANSQGSIRAQEIKTCRVLFAAVFGFCISWIPSTTVIFLESALKISIPSVAQSIPVLFASISAWINPVIYGVMNRAMRKEFQNILLCRKGD